MKKAIIFCSQGLGDGLLFLIVSNNLQRNGCEVITFHPFLEELQPLFLSLTIKKVPKKEDLFSLVNESDLIVINSDSTPLNRAFQELAMELLLEKTWILHASTCEKIDFKGNYRLNPKITMVKNLELFCKTALHLNDVVHPTSSGFENNWPAKKYLKLAVDLQKRGYRVVFVVGKEERFDWIWVLEYFIELPSFPNLLSMAKEVASASIMIGNDSGIGHLALCLQVPTLTIFSNRRKSLFWRSDRHLSKIVKPYPIPNIKKMRLRDNHWKKLIEVWRVKKAFNKLVKS